MFVPGFHTPGAPDDVVSTATLSGLLDTLRADNSATFTSGYNDFRSARFAEGVPPEVARFLPQAKGDHAGNPGDNPVYHPVWRPTGEQWRSDWGVDGVTDVDTAVLDLIEVGLEFDRIIPDRVQPVLGDTG